MPPERFSAQNPSATPKAAGEQYNLSPQRYELAANKFATYLGEYWHDFFASPEGTVVADGTEWELDRLVGTAHRVATGSASLEELPQEHGIREMVRNFLEKHGKLKEETGRDVMMRAQASQNTGQTAAPAAEKAATPDRGARTEAAEPAAPETGEAKQESADQKLQNEAYAIMQKAQIDGVPTTAEDNQVAGGGEPANAGVQAPQDAEPAAASQNRGSLAESMLGKKIEPKVEEPVQNEASPENRGSLAESLMGRKIEPQPATQDTPQTIEMAPGSGENLPPSIAAALEKGKQQIDADADAAEAAGKTGLRGKLNALSERYDKLPRWAKIGIGAAIGIGAVTGSKAVLGVGFPATLAIMAGSTVIRHNRAMERYREELVNNPDLPRPKWWHSAPTTYSAVIASVLAGLAVDVPEVKEALAGAGEKLGDFWGNLTEEKSVSFEDTQRGGMLAPQDAGLAGETPNGAAVEAPAIMPDMPMDGGVEHIEHVVRPGDTVWDFIKEDPRVLAATEGLSQEQVTYVVDALKDNLAEMTPEELHDLGIGSGDIDKIYLGETIDLDPLLNNETLMHDAVERAKNLSPEELQNIARNLR